MRKLLKRTGMIVLIAGLMFCGCGKKSGKESTDTNKNLEKAEVPKGVETDSKLKPLEDVVIKKITIIHQ